MVEPLEDRTLLTINIPAGLGGFEPAIAVDPNNPNVVAVAQFRTVNVSFDRGATFPVSTTVAAPGGYAGAGGDPSLAFDAQGRLYFSYLASNPAPVNPNFRIGVFSARFDVNAAAQTAPLAQNSTVALETNTNDHDKEWVAADHFANSPFRNNIYMMWTQFGGATQILFSRSTNGGVTWSAPIQIDNGGDGFVWPSELEVAPNGDVWVAWHTHTAEAAGNTGEVRMRRSTDGGVTFGAEIVPFPAGAADMTVNTPGQRIPGLLSWMQGSAQPRVLTDPVRPGTLYIIAADDPNNTYSNGDDADIVMARTTDNGATWTLSTISHGPVGTFQVMPAATIDEDGNIAVNWYDNRRGLRNNGLNGIPGDGDDNFLLDVFATVSTDGGLTFTNDFRLNNATFNPDLGAVDRFPPNNVLRIGEYNDMSSADGTVFSAWTGNTGAGQQIILDKFNILAAAGADYSEPNNTLGSAHVLGSVPAVTLHDRGLNQSDVVDYYKYTAHDTGKLFVSALYDRGVADIIVEVRDARNNLIATGVDAFVTAGLWDERLTIPVVAGQEYFIRVFTTDPLPNPVDYSLEVENFAAPVPTVTLDPAYDSGLSNDDLITSLRFNQRYQIHVDLGNFSGGAVPILTPAQATAGNTPGLAVQVFDNGVFVGYATVHPGTNNTVFDLFINADVTTFSTRGPNAAGPQGYTGWSNFVTAAVKVYDGQKTAGGAPSPATGRTSLADPLKVTVDITAPLAPTGLDLIPSSDSGVSNSDNITSNTAPAFRGIAEANARVRILADGVVIGEGLVGTDNADGVVGDGLGPFEVTVEPMVDGVYTISAVVEDIAGNISPASPAILQLTIDTLSPQRPTIDLLAASDTGSSNLDDVTRLTSVDVRVSAEPGATVVIKNGETVVDSFVMPAAPFTVRTLVVGGAIPAADLLEGPNPLSAEAFDAAGNRSHQSEELLVQIDTIAPLAPSLPDMLASSDSGSFNNDNVTKETAPAFQGVAEANSLLRLFANGVQVGWARVGSDLTNGEVGDGLGAWEVTVEPLVDGAYAITATAEDLAGNISPISQTLNITIDTLAPDTPYLDLIDASDSGRSNVDNITNDNTPTVTTTADDVQAAGLNLNPHEIRYRIFDRMGTGPDVLLVNSFVTIPGLSTANFFSDTLPLLADGVHNLKVEVEDRAGNISHAFLLNITIDTVAPPVPSVQIDPASTDTGVDGYPATIADRVTSDTGSSFVGTAEADSIVRLFADANPLSLGVIDGSDVAQGLTVAVPTDGNGAFPNGQWRQAVIRDLNDPNFFPFDGVRQMGATAEDVAGNVSSPGILDIFVDTQGPQITDVAITGSPAYNLFGTKPGNAAQGPTPLVNSITISVQDLPNRDTAFFPNHVALLAAIAATPGNYILKGDAGGYIPIQSVTVVNNPLVNGVPATATIQLNFANPLPDDRYTLIVLDDLVDPAGNKLDGESNAAEPNGGPSFPTGDKQPGGSFIGRFTVDSRPEVGVWAAGSVWVDTNGNAEFDPVNPDFTNRDIVYMLGYATDHVFNGNFATAPGDVADGFDKLAAYGMVNNQGRWLIDTNNDGVPDVVQTEPANLVGMPVAGDFDGNAVNGDEVALKSGNSWYLDTNHDFQVDTLLPGTTMQGFPIVGDFDGDGIDDLGAWSNDLFSLNLSTLGAIDGDTDVSFRFGFIGVRERPVAADVDGDGIDDLGLWVPDRAGAVPQEQSEWYLLVSGGNSILNRIVPDPILGTPTVNFTPIPFGNDVFWRFGDDFALPLLGNFDPPVAPADPVPADTPAPFTINGTSGNDTLEIIAGTSFATSIVKLNGVVQAIDPAAVKVEFVGGAGKDTVKFTGTDGADGVELWPSSGVFSGAGYLFSVSQVEAISASGGGGNDTAVLHDSQFSDSFIGAAQQATFIGKNGNATHFSHAVAGFETVNVVAEAGGKDIATLNGASKTDKFVASLTKAEMSIGKTAYTASGFEAVVAKSGIAGTGDALLSDSAGNDKFTAKPGYAQMVGAGASVTAQGFARVTATASGGFDTADLTGSTGNDTLLADRTSTRFSGKGFNNLAKAFDQVLANGLGGSDTAQIVGGKVATGKLTRGKAPVPSNVDQLVWLLAFEQVQLRDNAAGTAKKSLRAAANQVFSAYWA